MKLLTLIFPFFFLSCSAQPMPNKVILTDPNVAMATGEGLIKASSNAIYFSFTTTSASPRTSAGVYDGDKLVRTLWSNVAFPAGLHNSYWDGKNDLQQFVANGKYQVKVLKSGIEWDWLGTFFNSSDSTTGATKWHGASLIGIQFMGNKAFALPYYLEGNYQLFTFEANHPNQKQTHGGLIGQSTFRSCTDGKYVYALASTNYDTYFAYAFDANGNEVNFANGIKYESHNSVIASFKTSNDSLVAGIAVQKHGDCFFTSVPKLNRVLVFNKATGKFIRNNKVVGAGLMACDNNNKLWIIANDIPTQFAVNTDGSLTATGIILKGISNVQQLDISPDNTTISLIDGGLDVQQIKSYNNNTGVPTWILGQLGGYRKTAIVTNDRFCFSAAPKSAAELSFINYASDGSFWVGDKGNFRYLHFDKNRHFINQFAFLPQIYNTYVDVNSPTHVYAAYVRATVDYNASNPQKAWVLDRNYTGKISYNIEENENFHKVFTLKNGKTYATMRENNQRGTDPYHKQIFELTDSGVRATGVKYSWQATMGKEGDIWQKVTAGPKTAVSYLKTPLIGFDAHNNPLYGLSVTYATIPMYKDSLPMDGEFSSQMNGDLVLFDPSVNDGFHLGIFSPKTNTYKVLVLPSTGAGTYAEYPRDGYFPNGNGTNYPGGQQNIIDSFIIWNAHNEFWNRSGQTSMWQMLDKNGLNIGVWGTLQDVSHPLDECVAWNSGNAIHTQIVKIGKHYFVCWNDESRHGGVHVAKIKFMNTLNYETFNVVKNTNPELVFSYKDLMAGLPKFQSINGLNNAWTVNAPPSSGWTNRTNWATYGYNQDVLITFSEKTAGTQRNILVDLGKNNSSSWKITGNVAFPNAGANGIANGDLAYIDVLDATNKVIARLEINQVGSLNYQQHNCQINGKTVWSIPGGSSNFYEQNEFAYFELTSNGNTLTYTSKKQSASAPIYDNKGSLLTPKYIDIHFFSNGSPYERMIDIGNLKFWNTGK